MPAPQPPALYWPTLIPRAPAALPVAGVQQPPLLRVAVHGPWQAAWQQGMALAGVNFPTTYVDDAAPLHTLVAVLADCDLALLPPGIVADAACAVGVPLWLLGVDSASMPPAPCVCHIPCATDASPNWTTELARQLSALSAPPPEDALRQLEQGRQALEREDLVAACTPFWALWRETPTLARAVAALAVCAHRAGLPHQAVALGVRACRLDPQNAESHSNLGAFLKQIGQIETARAYQQRAVDIAPNSAQAHSNLGNTLGALGHWEDAVAHAQQAVTLAPNAAEYRYNLGIGLRESTRYAEALAAFRQAQALAGGHLKAQLHIALTELLTGDMPAGWQHYDCRWDQVDAKEKRRQFEVPEWKGENLAGKTLLVHAEQGFGDSFQFLRFIPELAQRGARVILVVQPEVHTLASRLEGVHTLVASGAPLPPFDLHTPLLGVPAALGMRLADIPAAIPYLSPNKERQLHWQERLSAHDRYRVALVWAGRPTHGNDANRSLALQALAPLLALPGIAFFALQKGPAAAQAHALPQHLQPQVLDEEIHDFEDTAAILACMDELVTVDTSVAHLAGALGCRTRVLLPQVPDWRWLLDRNDSPWYPQATLYRQTRRGVWSDPIAQIKHDVCNASQQAHY